MPDRVRKTKRNEQSKPQMETSRTKNLDIKAFADAIGVSPTTVSRSISGRGRVSSDTRQMVLQRMKEMGYTPNLNAQRLVTGRSRTVALYLYYGAPHDYDLFLVGMMRGVQQALLKENYGLFIAGNSETLQWWVNSRAVDGLIVVGDLLDESLLADCANPDLPSVVVCTRPHDLPRHVGQVFMDLGSGASQAARNLVEQGHRRIAYIGSEFVHPVLPAFQAELQRLGAPLQDELVVILEGIDSEQPGVHEGEAAMRRLLQLPKPPTAVFARTDHLAMGALRAAHAAGLRVPDQLSIIGHDDLYFTQFTDPPLSSARIDCDLVGQAAAELFFSLLEHPGRAYPPRIVPTQLVKRQSVGAPWE